MLIPPFTFLVFKKWEFTDTCFDMEVGMWVMKEGTLANPLPGG